MSKRGGNFEYNYPRLVDYCEANEFLYQEYAGGQHMRIAGATRIIDIWPSRMVYHVIKDEDATPSHMLKWPKLDRYFNEVQVDRLLNGGLL